MAISILIAGVVIFAAIWLSSVTSTLTRGLPRLPMQFGLDGEPTWSASRHVALAIGPIVTALVSVFVLPGGWFIQGVAGIGCLGFQALYLYLLSKWARRTQD
jgi:hypothetical protein